MSAGQRIQPEHPATRKERRDAVVQVVEYSRFPRREAGERRRVGYTQDRSAAGLGLDLPGPVKPGELLHVTLRDIDGNVAIEGLGRVVWCEQADDGRTRAGLAMLRESGQRPLLRVREALRGRKRGRQSLGPR